MGRLPLNRTTAPQLLRLFDHCFRQGVFDAMDSFDDYVARDFVERHKADGGYGLLYDDENFDWRRWRFTLARWCREERLGSVGDVLIDSPWLWKSGRKTFLVALLPISMRFYLMGIEEWLDYPNRGNLGFFKIMRKVHWKKMEKPYLQKITTQDFISYIQEFVYERQRLHIQGDLEESKYDSFATAMWTLTKRYPTGYGALKKDF